MSERWSRFVVSYIQGKRPMTRLMSLYLALIFGTKPMFWYDNYWGRS